MLARRELQDVWRELRRKQNTVERVAGLLEDLIARFGGAHRLVERWQSLTESARPSFQIKSFETILRIMSVVERACVVEREESLQRQRSGQLSAAELDGMTDDELHDTLCEPLRQMQTHGLLCSLLQRMIERGELRLEDLPHPQLSKPVGADGGG